MDDHEDYKSEDDLDEQRELLEQMQGGRPDKTLKKIHTQELSRIFKSKKDIYEILVIEGKLANLS